MSKTKLLICTKGKSCKKRGAKEVFCALEEQIECMGLEDKVRLKKVDCLGMCGNGPAIQIKSQKLSYGRVSPDDCEKIIRRLTKNKKPIDRLVIKR